MVLPDTVKLATTTVDGYGDESVTVLTDVRAAFIQKTQATHAANQEDVQAATTIYLDPTNQIVLDNSYRLEGMYIIAQPFNQSQDESWYRITHVTVAQRKLLGNSVDNIHCTLEKVAGLAYVS